MLIDKITRLMLSWTLEALKLPTSCPSRARWGVATDPCPGPSFACLSIHVVQDLAIPSLSEPQLGNYCTGHKGAVVLLRPPPPPGGQTGFQGQSRLHSNKTQSRRTRESHAANFQVACHWIQETPRSSHKGRQQSLACPDQVPQLSSFLCVANPASALGPCQIERERQTPRVKTPAFHLSTLQ